MSSLSGGPQAQDGKRVWRKNSRGSCHGDVQRSRLDRACRDLNHLLDEPGLQAAEWHRKHLLEVWPAQTAGWRTGPELDGFCCRLHPRCKGGLIQVVILGRAASPCPWACCWPVAIRVSLFSLCVPRVPHRAARGAIVGCLGCDAPTHDHHRGAAARALQSGAFAQWWLRRWLYRWRHARRREGRRRVCHYARAALISARGDQELQVQGHQRPL